jgi:hypothetical protein
MFDVSDDDHQTLVALATSVDGLNWDRRGTTIAPRHNGDRGVRSPCAARGRNGIVRLWYAAPNSSLPAASDRIWTADAVGFSL